MKIAKNIGHTVTILSFDPGTANLGYAAIVGNAQTSEVRVGNYFGVFKTNKWLDGSEVAVRERIDALGTDVSTLIKDVKPTFIAMEDFVEQGKRVGKTYKEMSYLTEHLRLVCRSLGYEVVIYANGIWKRKTLKATNASKIQVQHYIKHTVQDTEKILKSPDHVWDSVGIGYCRWLDYLSKVRGNDHGTENTSTSSVSIPNGPRRLPKRTRVPTS